MVISNLVIPELNIGLTPPVLSYKIVQSFQQTLPTTGGATLPYDKASGTFAQVRAFN
jgi:hypothetical protein